MKLLKHPLKLIRHALEQSEGSKLKTQNYSNSSRLLFIDYFRYVAIAKFMQIGDTLTCMKTYFDFFKGFCGGFCAGFCVGLVGELVGFGVS